ncbi:hypothetical protein ACQPZG_32530 [Streptomyces sp. CA-294286]|uniref:hypothetical protein n=1 Tax=Streptomyces sp. CA-294286 TaxID=3240070 RepID=UPI003D90E105
MSISSNTLRVAANGTTTAARGGLARSSAMIVAASTAGAIFATATGAHAADSATEPRGDTSVTLTTDDGFTPEELEQAEALKGGIAELGVTEKQFAAALDVAFTRLAPDALHDRLAALPADATAEQLVQAAYPGDEAAQAALLAVFANEGVRKSVLPSAVEDAEEKPMMAPMGWWDETEFVAKCGAAIACVLLTLAPAGSSIKVVRAVALYKKYGAEKTANIIWRFVNGKRVGSAEREAVKAFIGITAISSACSR